MFFGATIKPGQKVSLPSDQGQTLHLSQACLSQGKNGTTYVQVIDNGKKINLCALVKDTAEHAQLDLFLQPESGVQLTVEGSSTVDVSGYFEPEPDANDFDMPDLDDESDEEAAEADDGADQDAMLAAAKALPAKRLATLTPDKAAKKGAKLAEVMGKAAAAAPEGEEQESSDEDDEEEEDDEDTKGGDDDDSSSDGDDDAVDVQEVLRSVKAQAKGKAAAKAGIKRKAPDTPVPAAAKQQPKKAKKDAAPAAAAAAAAAPAAGGDEAAKYQAALTKYLAAHGRSSISQIGTQVKKPAGVKKLGAFLKEHSGTFKVENDFVSLAK